MKTNKRVKRDASPPITASWRCQCATGTKPLELAKVKWDVKVGAEKEWVPVLEMLKKAVLCGELDFAMETVSNKLRSPFCKG